MLLFIFVFRWSCAYTSWLAISASQLCNLLSSFILLHSFWLFSPVRDSLLRSFLSSVSPLQSSAITQWDVDTMQLNMTNFGGTKIALTGSKSGIRNPLFKLPNLQITTAENTPRFYHANLWSKMNNQDASKQANEMSRTRQHRHYRCLPMKQKFSHTVTCGYLALSVILSWLFRPESTLWILNKDS